MICTFDLDLQPGTSTASITIKVTLDPNFTGPSVFNQATATATVDPPVTARRSTAHRSNDWRSWHRRDGHR